MLLALTTPFFRVTLPAFFSPGIVNGENTSLLPPARCVMDRASASSPKASWNRISSASHWTRKGNRGRVHGLRDWGEPSSAMRHLQGKDCGVPIARGWAW